ncbi:MAG TPA: UDP-2,3-diacylglucosamine diphosphatase [Gemmatimonadota bacterium]|jgi:UDP-2,3-diacylglucosamine hydrolase
MSELHAPAPAYFFSDAHLGADTAAVERVKRDRLAGFFDLVAGRARSLVCLGDLFDFWFEYETAIPGRHFDVLCRLRRLSEAGVQLFFLGGNHDFWVRRGSRPGFLEREIGFRILEQGDEIVAGGLRVAVFHGDGVGKRDAGYRALKALLRNRLAIESFRWVHPDLARGIGGLVADASRLRTGNRPDPATVERLRRFAVALLRARPDLDAILAGHTHLPEELAVGGARYINLGDWIHHATYAVVEDGTLALRRFPHAAGPVAPADEPAARAGGQALRPPDSGIEP